MVLLEKELEYFTKLRVSCNVGSHQTTMYLSIFPKRQRKSKPVNVSIQMLGGFCHLD